MSDFRDAKVGDRVWRLRKGWGVISGINVENRYPIHVQGDCFEYRYDGRTLEEHLTPDLFWDEVKIIPPPKPKRKVKKVIEGYIQLTDRRVDDGAAVWASNLYKTIYGAVSHAEGNNSRGQLAGGPIFIRHEYEVEE